MKTTKNAIVIGGTSGIGRSLVKLLVKNNWTVGVTGRRTALLHEIKATSKYQIYTQEHDVTELETSDTRLDQLFNQMATVDLIIVSSGYADTNHKVDWKIEKKVIDTNVNGIAKVYEYAFTRFKMQGYGHLVGISSIASIRGNRHCPSYSAAKAFQANYLEALRCISKKRNLKIKITDIQPGFVDTPMAKGGDGMFWIAPVDKAAEQIYTGILKEKRKVYITKRWRLIAWVMTIAPSWVWEKI